MAESENKEILVFGAGWIGSRISSFLNCPVVKRRLNTYEDIQEEIDRTKPKVIINCIGHFGKNVDSCELDKTKTLFAHSFVPLLLGEAAVRNAIKLVHISSGCVYNYDYKLNRPLAEDTPVDFFDLYYSRSKIYAETALSALGDSTNILQLRIRMPLDYIPHRRNLLDKLVDFSSVIDIPNSVTYIPDFLEALKHLLKLDAEGVFNVVNYGGLRYREILEEYKKYDLAFGYAITDLNSLKMVRTNLILSTDKLEETGFTVRDIHDVLPECVEKWVAERKRLNAGQKS
jgi:dTDP-4-dehydrorhamnose reductase